MPYDIERIREDFPALNKPISGKLPIYFDNACMTLKPKQVVEAMNEYYYNHPGCHRRAIHKFGELTTLRYKKARESVQKFINANEPCEIVFTRNTTEAINLIANSFPFKKGDTVLTTELEHNSNLLPWQVLARKKGIIHKVFSLNDDMAFDLERFEKILAQGIRLVSVFHTSHVTGITLPIKDIVDLSHNYGALVLIDGAQAVAHKKIDVQDLDIDLFAFSFHKMLGPTGMGALYAKKDIFESMSPFLIGGEAIDDADYNSFVLSELPYRFESGLQNYAGAIGAEAAIKYLEAVGFGRINEQEFQLNEFITREISRLSRIKLLGPRQPGLRGSIINFYIEGIDSGELSILLDKTNNIMLRSGVHCCHAWYKKHNLPTTLRAAVYFYNTSEEAEVFIRTIKQISRYF